MPSKNSSAVGRIVAVVVLASAAPACVADLETSDGDVTASESSALVGRINVHRAFKRSNREHFYTLDANEAIQAGYQLEYVNYFGLGASRISGSVAFFRCFIPDAGRHGMHFYTTDVSCETSVLNLEQFMGDIAVEQQPGTAPLYRCYHARTHDHFYTLNADEVDVAVRDDGYHFEGIAGYVLP